ncbi:MAG: NAD(P)(+) transhydrogenase (Re/Si-specific) subunit alpha, partial [Alphaproteobacteria bacterium]
MKIAVLKERWPEEARVAASPEVVARYRKAGFAVTIEAGAGSGARFPDDEYREAGAEVQEDPAAVLKDADIILTVRGLPDELLGAVKRGAVLLGMLDPLRAKDRIARLAEAGLVVFAL